MKWVLSRSPLVDEYINAASILRFTIEKLKNEEGRTTWSIWAQTPENMFLIEGVSTKQDAEDAIKLLISRISDPNILIASVY